MFGTGIMPVSNLGVVIKSMVVTLYFKIGTPYSRREQKNLKKK